MLRIREIIKSKNVDITDLAKRLNVTRQTVHYYINQDEKNSVDTLNRIAAALGISVSDFFERPASDTITCPKCGARLEIKAKE
jgi:transcriptional regulator with XRE-family HTH domain